MQFWQVELLLKISIRNLDRLWCADHEQMPGVNQPQTGVRKNRMKRCNQRCELGWRKPVRRCPLAHDAVVRQALAADFIEFLCIQISAQTCMNSIGCDNVIFPGGCVQVAAAVVNDQVQTILFQHTTIFCCKVTRRRLNNTTVDLDTVHLLHARQHQGLYGDSHTQTDHQ